MNVIHRALANLAQAIERPPETLSSERLAKFLRCQRLAYQCALDIARELQVGWTEKQTARLMDTYLQDHGVKLFFHKSFAWFGDRTGFHGFKSYKDFMPSARRLCPEDVVILDTAPVLDGVAADIGYTFCLSENLELVRAKKFLLQMREEIPKLFMSKMTTAEIWKKVDLEMQKAGYSNAHAKYPFSVLGHRLHEVPFASFSGAVRPFSLQTYLLFLSKGIYPDLLGPLHKGRKEGLWAIEPHLGTPQFGAKFEEILVVEKDKSYWLDEQVPHIQEARELKYAK